MPAHLITSVSVLLNQAGWSIIDFNSVNSDLVKENFINQFFSPASMRVT
jgi:hypothetical protein